MEKEMNNITFKEAVELNKTEPVGFYFEDEDTTNKMWFPVKNLWEEPISNSTLLDVTYADLLNGIWLKE